MELDYCPASNMLNAALFSLDESKNGAVAKEIIEGLLYQFAYQGEKGGRAMLWTGGMSALERAFDFIGWDNPHFVPEMECEIEGCHSFADCGLSTPNGVIQVCTNHCK